jgi:hypothetical protein
LTTKPSVLVPAAMADKLMASVLSGGFAINGESVNDYSGWSISSAGDVNGDGLDDLIVGGGNG